MGVIKEEKKRNTAQTASELAIFGGIFIFVLGLIIRYAVNFNYIQNQSLTAMRLAMQQSFRGAESGSNARNFSTVLFIEDRKDPSSTRYGAMSRTPYVISGSGAFTKNFFLATEWGESWNLPIMDVFINGKYFTFTTANFVTYILDHNHSDPNQPDYYPKKIVYGQPDQPCHVDGICDIAKGEDCWTCPKDCLMYDGSLCNPVQWDLSPSCTATQGQTKDGHSLGQGCPLLFKRVVNGGDLYNRVGYWAPAAISNGEPFDLDRCNNTETPGLLPPVVSGSGVDVPNTPTEGMCPPGAIPADQHPCTPWDTFTWQWYPVDATTKTLAIGESQSISYDVDGDLKQEEILSVWARRGLSFSLVTATPPEATSCGVQGETAVAEVNVIDMQEGDIDFSFNTRDEGKGPGELSPVYPNPAIGCREDLPHRSHPGLQSEAKFYESPSLITSVAPNAFFTIEEGKLYEHIAGEEGKQYVRDVTKHDRVDVIERIIQLSNDTGRVCGNGSGLGWDVPKGCPNRGQNPGVEICNPRWGPNSDCSDQQGDCNAPENRFKTCFDENDFKLYVRSKLSDLTGRKWITDVSSDQQIPLR